MAVAELQVVLSKLSGLSQDVVVHIGQVLDVGHLVAQVFQVPMQDVEAEVGEGMAQVAGVIGRHAADVEAHRATPDRLERNLLFGPRIEEAKRHGPDSRWRSARPPADGGSALRRAVESGHQGSPTYPGELPTYAVLGSRAMWEVLRWMIVFVLALLLIVTAIYLVTGRPLPIPQF